MNSGVTKDVSKDAVTERFRNYYHVLIPLQTSASETFQVRRKPVQVKTSLTVSANTSNYVRRDKNGNIIYLDLPFSFYIAGNFSKHFNTEEKRSD